MTDLTKLSASDLRVRVAEVVKLRQRATGGAWRCEARGFTLWVVNENGYVVAEGLDMEDGEFIAASHTQTDLLQELARRLEGAERALQPFAHSDFQEALGGQIQGDDSPMFGRNKALLTLGDFRRAAAAIAHAGAHNEKCDK